MKEGYYIIYNGECFQSVFPTVQAHMSQLHTSISDAIAYMREECGIKETINIRKEES